MLIYLAGGGTGGHLCPGLALADALRRLAPEARVAFIGTREGLDRRLVPAAGYPLHLLATGRGSPLDWRRPMNAPRLIWAMGQCWRLFRRERPAAVVALGGFAAAVPGWMARRMDVPMFLLEPNAVPGRVNRRLARWAKTAHLQFSEAAAGFAGAPCEFREDGVPLRESVRALAGELNVSETVADSSNDAAAERDALLVLGGSQGARRLNELVVGAAPAFHAATGAGIVHVAGEAHAEAVRAAYAEGAAGVPVEVLGFCDGVAALLRRARVLASRAGAGTIAEAAAAAVPTLLAPLSTAMDDHQRANARAAQARGGAEWIEETTATPSDFAARLIALWTDAAKREAMSRAWRAFARVDAAERIAGHVLEAIS